MQCFRKLGVPAIWIVIVFVFHAATVESARKSEKLPTCDQARKLYKKHKLYDVLGVKKSVRPKDLRRAYKKMAVQCHPDKNVGDKHADENFIAISGAYETLSDPEKRKEFDLGGGPHSGKQSGPAPKGGHQQQGGNWQQDVDVNNIFKTFFANGGGGRGSTSEDQAFHDSFHNFNWGDRQRQQQQRQRRSGSSGGFGQRPPKPSKPATTKEVRELKAKLSKFYDTVSPLERKSSSDISNLAKRYAGDKEHVLRKKLKEKYGTDYLTHNLKKHKTKSTGESKTRTSSKTAKGKKTGRNPRRRS